MAPLPSRVLQESDSPPNIADLSAEENHTLYVFGWMSSVNQLLGKNIRGWERGKMRENDFLRENASFLQYSLFLSIKQFEKNENWVTL